jgi:cysteine desulfurase
MRKDLFLLFLRPKTGPETQNHRCGGGLIMRIIYLDNNATTQVSPEVLEVMVPYFHDLYGNPSSAHSFGGHVAEKISEAREKVAHLLGALPEEIIFTSGGTESDNAAIRSALAGRPEKRHVLTSQVEHPAIRSLCRYLSKQGYRITEIPVNTSGDIDMAAYEQNLTADTAIVSLMWANNETGVIFPVEEAAELAHKKGVPFHTDAVQAAGKIPIDLRGGSIDMLSISGHKLHGPKGIGILYVRKGTRFMPFIIGGHQERNRRAGTENAPAIIGLGKACELAARHMEEENTRVRQLRDRLEASILSKVPHTHVNGGDVPRLPNTSNISFEFVEGEAILLHLDEYGICASTGSACTSGSLEPSHVLLAMGVSPATAQGSIRFSLSIYNSEEEIDIALEKIPGIVQKLRNMSPLYRSAEKGRQAHAA